MAGAAADNTLAPDGYRARVVDSEVEHAFGVRRAGGAPSLRQDLDGPPRAAHRPTPGPWPVSTRPCRRASRGVEPRPARLRRHHGAGVILAGSAQRPTTSPATPARAGCGASACVPCPCSSRPTPMAKCPGRAPRESCRAVRDSGASQTCCRGGWPGQIGLPLPEVQQNLRDYLASCHRAAAEPHTTRRGSRGCCGPSPATRHRRPATPRWPPTSSPSRCTGTPSAATWPETGGGGATRVVGALRSRAPLRKSPKWHFADPSLAAAALGADAGRLMADASTLGLLFESLVVRDLRILAQPLGGRASISVTHPVSRPTPSLSFPTDAGSPSRPSSEAATPSRPLRSPCCA